MGQDSSSRSRSFGESVRWLWHESLVRHVVAEKDESRPVVVPLLVLIVVGVIVPWLVVIGGVVAILMGYTLRMERRGDASGEESTMATQRGTAEGTVAPPGGAAEAPPVNVNEDTTSISGGSQPAESSDPPDGT